MLLRRDRPRAAVAEYEKGAKAVASGNATRGDPSASWVFPVKLGRTYLALGEPDRALKALAPVQALHPDLPWPNLIAGEALVAKGEPQAAIAPLRAALATNPFDPRVHCALAAAYADARRRRAARRPRCSPASSSSARACPKASKPNPYCGKLTPPLAP